MTWAAVRRLSGCSERWWYSNVKHDVHVYPDSGHRFMSKASGFEAVPLLAKIVRMQ